MCFICPDYYGENVFLYYGLQIASIVWLGSFGDFGGLSKFSYEDCACVEASCLVVASLDSTTTIKLVENRVGRCVIEWCDWR